MSHVPSFTIPPKKIVVITAPSGSGKSTVVRKLLSQKPELAFSISCTTRAKRPGEIDGDHYHFINNTEFQKKVSAGEFAEYEEVYPGQFYGTLKSEIERIWKNRQVALFDIDVKGAESLKKLYGNDALVLFVAPPDKETLARRLTNRNTESKSTLKTRIAKSEKELEYQSKADKVVVNRDFDICYMNVKNIITNFLQPVVVMQHHH
ncbi:MAG: guanylate kinase [Chitinophagales bacterium]